MHSPSELQATHSFPSESVVVQGRAVSPEQVSTSADRSPSSCRVTVVPPSSSRGGAASYALCCQGLRSGWGTSLELLLLLSGHDSLVHGLLWPLLLPLEESPPVTVTSLAIHIMGCRDWAVSGGCVALSATSSLETDRSPGLVLRLDNAQVVLAGSQSSQQTAVMTAVLSEA